MVRQLVIHHPWQFAFLQAVEFALLPQAQFAKDEIR
jgi:hypothetical protein